VYFLVQKNTAGRFHGGDKDLIQSRFRQTTLRIALIAAGCVPLHAATLCVNPAVSTATCYATIYDAVNAAAPGSTIQVAPGTYNESVTISKTLALIGTDGQTVVDATGKSNGFLIDGTSAPPASPLRGVVISGFTIKNANFEGIVAIDASGLTISNNTVIGNDKALVYSANPTCAGLPAFETNESFDCGEGIHLTGVDHSTIAGNMIEDNAGGMLLSDETGPTFSNLITGNTVRDNAYDCGITLASHGRAPSVPPGLNFGIYNNTISKNTVQHNGSIGQGAGVGIFAPGPGSSAYGNVVIGNSISDNGDGGVTMHNHAAAGVGGVPSLAPPVNLNNNTIAGNDISGNQADNDDPKSPGFTGISIVSVAPVMGTVISENNFGDEIADIAFSAPAGSIEAHLNNFTANAIAVALESGGSVDASQSYFGCPGGIAGNAGAPAAGSGMPPSGPGNGPGCAVLMGSPIYVSSSLPAAFGAPAPQLP
jgi:parallel beta-helix repeat protein